MEITEETKKKLLDLYDVDPYSDNEFGIKHGIEETLDVLGIVVKGINDYDNCD